MTMNYPTRKFFCPVPPHLKVGHFHHQRGLSLIELMISIAIGLFLVIGITALIVQQSGTRTELEKSSRQIENGRYAMQVLQDDIQLAGYYGEYSTVLLTPGLDVWNTGTPSLPDPCTTTIFNADPTVAQLGTAIPLHLQGYNDVPATMPTPPSACLTAGNHLDGTDILVIRRASATTVSVASAVANQPYLQTGIHPLTKNLSYVFGSGSDISAFTLQTKAGATAPLRPYMVRIYFVSPCSTPAGAVCANTDDTIPTLRRMTLGAGSTGPTFLPPESLVEGIENLQINYGIDYPVAPATIGDGSVDCYVVNPAAPTAAEIDACPASAAAYFAGATAATNWSNVMAVRLNILARNTEETAGYVDEKTYNLGDAGPFGPFEDRYKRHVFSGLVRAINPSGRRE
jgi:type IV pilus assembly protein PilW